MTNKDKIKAEILRRVAQDLSSIPTADLISMLTVDLDGLQPKKPKAGSRFTAEEKLRRALERVGRDASPRDVMRAANIHKREDFDRLMSSLSFDLT